MTVADIMSTRVVTVEMDDSMKDVKEIFDNVAFHHLIVVGNSKKVVGVISDRDLLRTLSPYLGTVAELRRDLASLNKKVHQVMGRDLVLATADCSISDLVKKFKENPVSCVPVVDDLGKPIGVVTWHDLLKIIQ